MQPAHDEFEALSDEQRKGHSPYEAILAKSGLAKHLRDIFEDLCEYGMVDVFVDDCIEVGFCVGRFLAILYYFLINFYLISFY